MNSINKIYITGYMGSGKSFVAKHLSRTLDCGLIELDEMLENESGMRISEIFEKYGEAHFRKMEKEAIIEIQAHQGLEVVSLGGGSYCQDEILEPINADNFSFTVYLKHEAALLVERLKSEKAHRPIISAEEDLLAFVTKHLEEREPYYSAADLVIIDEIDIDKITNQILAYRSYQNQKLSTI